MTTINIPSDDLKAQLKREFVGKTLLEVAAPAAVFDLGKIRRNCTRMLEVVDTLQFRWRAHIKTHKPGINWLRLIQFLLPSQNAKNLSLTIAFKTEELTRLQVGGGVRPANVIVSTIKEAENITPLLLELKRANRAVNVLYGFPAPPSGIARLAAVSKQLGPEGLSLFVDHPDQLPVVYKVMAMSGYLPHVYIKIDMGYGRAGVSPQSQVASQLIFDVLKAEEVGAAAFYGLYTHAGQSYYGNDRASAVDLLRQELVALLATADLVKSASPKKKLVLSVGATPTTTSVHNMLIQDSALTTSEQTAVTALRGVIEEIKSKNCEIELHAGVYPVLDVQQLATHALSSSMLGWPDLALTIVVEVASIYPGRGQCGRPEALVAAGSLGLGREPCKAYPGWGIVSPWNIPDAIFSEVGPEEHEGWIVGRISQEHGILTWSGEELPSTLTIGQKIRIFPNHACVAGACFDWYLVVDSDRSGNEHKIIDVWPRWRGW